jgi:hypothetical protein
LRQSRRRSHGDRTDCSRHGIKYGNRNKVLGLVGTMRQDWSISGCQKFSAAQPASTGKRKFPRNSNIDNDVLMAIDPRMRFRTKEDVAHPPIKLCFN